MKVYSDNLITIWRDTTGNTTARGKRVSANHPLTRAERRAYVMSNGSITALVRTIRDTRNVSLAEALALANAGRGGDFHALRAANPHRHWNRVGA